MRKILKYNNDHLGSTFFILVLLCIVCLSSCEPKTDEDFIPGGDSTGGPIFSLPYEAKFEIDGEQVDFNTVIGNDIERLYAANQSGSSVVNDSVRLSLGTVFFRRLSVGAAAGQKNQTLSVFFRQQLPVEELVLRNGAYIFEDSTDIDTVFHSGPRSYYSDSDYHNMVSLIFTDTAQNAYYSDSIDNSMSTFSVLGNQIIMQQVYGYSQKVSGTFNAKLYSPVLQDTVTLTNGYFTGVFTNFRDAYMKK